MTGKRGGIGFLIGTLALFAGKAPLAFGQLIHEDDTWFDHELFSERSSQILGIGGAAAFASLMLLDRPAKNYFSASDRWGNLSSFGNEIWGTGVPCALIAGGTWGFGVLTGREYEQLAGAAHAKALATTGIVTIAMKYSFARERPDGSSQVSFPSGHTSTAFAGAASLMGSYGPIVGVPAYAMAVLTGLGRVESNRHYVSDIVFGAALGIWTGRAFTTSLRRARTPASLPPDEDHLQVSFQPYYETTDEFGFRASVKF
jgi:membrane-associated phospholipid phosphatase